jgi:hypothetical protein
MLCEWSLREVQNSFIDIFRELSYVIVQIVFEVRILLE